MTRKVREAGVLVECAAAAARSAAAFLRETRRPRDPSSWRRKGFSDFVTHVDRKAEEIIAEALLERTADAVIMGEELSPTVESGGLLWVVDPLDGTTNYLHGYPAYAVSIAAVLDGMLVAGVVLDVPRDLLYRAAAGGGAWLGETRLEVSLLGEPRDALLGTGFPFKAQEELQRYTRQLDHFLRTTSGVRRAGAAALDLVDVAAGRLEGFWELRLAPWDVAAGALMVREAGGVVTDEAGSENILRHGSIVAGNPPLHRWLLECLSTL